MIIPVLEKNNSLCYLDSASTTLMSASVLLVMQEYYEQYPVNIHRGLYDLSAQASQAYEAARQSVASFIGARQAKEVIFTAGTTASINMLALMLEDRFDAGDNIVLTRYEHHANLLPWQRLAKKRGVEVRFLELTEDYRIDDASIAACIDERTKLVSFGLVSNTLGCIAPAQKMIAQAKSVGALTCIDAAQALGHMPIDVSSLDCEFLVASAHKAYGPKGIGLLYGKHSLLEQLEPAFVGGGMVNTVSYEKATWAELPEKFEAGTPAIAEAIGFAAALKEIQSVGWEKIQAHEDGLTNALIDSLIEIDGVQVIGPKEFNQRLGVISFTIDGIHPHDVAQILADQDIAVRAGHHCTAPLMKHLGIVGTTRASIGYYNTLQDIERLREGVLKVKDVFGK